MSFDSSWLDAEQEVFKTLLKATKSKEGDDAFRGHLPPAINVWALFTGGEGGNEQTTWSPDVVSIHFGARIEGAFAKRVDCQTFMMQVLKVLPILNSGNVQVFRVRLGGYAEPVHEYIPIGNEDRVVPAVTINFGCELVFSTGGRL